jgi:uncharacterized membrane protein
MVAPTTWYVTAAVMIIIGIILMSVGSSYIAKLKTKAEKDKSPWISAVVIGPIMIVIGVALVIATFVGVIGKNNAAGMVGTPPSAAAGSVSNAPSQNPVEAIEKAAETKMHNAQNAVANAKNIANAAKTLRGALAEAN